MQIFVGSENPVKINSVILAASEQWPDVVVHGFSVPSGISEQPRTDDETRAGAENRAEKALEVGIKTLKKDAKGKAQTFLGVGMEGGVFLNENGELWSTVWVTVIDADRKSFSVNGARFKVPDAIAQPILAGGEMGPVVGSFFKDSKLKQKQGAIGVITEGFVDRTEEYAGLAKLAIGLWFGREWEKRCKSSL